MAFCSSLCFGSGGLGAGGEFWKSVCVAVGRYGEGSLHSIFKCGGHDLIAPPPAPSSFYCFCQCLYVLEHVKSLSPPCELKMPIVCFRFKLCDAQDQPFRGKDSPRPARVLQPGQHGLHEGLGPRQRLRGGKKRTHTRAEPRTSPGEIDARCAWPGELSRGSDVRIALKQGMFSQIL